VKNARTILTAALFLAGMHMGFSQGFVNLNFESANATGYAPGSRTDTSVLNLTLTAPSPGTATAGGI